tara:strand:- start:590 stop:1441 length:852 start_codon:yes stop_codon:yes gene_type:complete
MNQNSSSLILKNNISNHTEVTGKDSVRYSYNSKGLISSRYAPSNVIVYNNNETNIRKAIFINYFEYNSNGDLVNELDVRKSNSDSTIVSQSKYIYNLKNQLIKKDNISNGTIVSQSKYMYNLKNQLIKKEQISFYANRDSKTNYFYFYEDTILKYEIKGDSTCLNNDHSKCSKTVYFYDHNSQMIKSNYYNEGQLIKSTLITYSGDTTFWYDSNINSNSKRFVYTISNNKNQIIEVNFNNEQIEYYSFLKSGLLANVRTKYLASNSITNKRFIYNKKRVVTHK